MQVRVALDAMSAIPRGWPIPFVEQQFILHGTDVYGVPQVTSRLGQVNIPVSIIDVIIVWVILEGLVILVVKKKRITDHPSKT